MRREDLYIASNGTGYIGSYRARRRWKERRNKAAKIMAVFLASMLGVVTVSRGFCGVLAGGDTDVLAVDDEFALFEVVIYGAFELTVHCVVFEHVGHVVYGQQVVDGNNLDVVTLDGGTEDKATDTSKAIDTDFSHFGYFEYWV